jgi:hypothetical protein
MVPLTPEVKRNAGSVLIWGMSPACARAGANRSGRVIYVEAVDEKSVLICFEEGLRHGGLGAVVAEVARLSMTASRRLQLAAEGSGTIGIAIHRWRRPAEAVEFGQPTASVTRWRVSALPATPLPVPGVGRARWQVELIRCRAGESADFEWRPAMRRVVSLFLPTWSTDRVRRTLGGAAPPAGAPACPDPPLRGGGGWCLLVHGLPASLRMNNLLASGARTGEGIYAIGPNL